MSNNHVLVVEDDEDILNMVVYNLINSGFSAKGVSTGEAALREVSVSVPSLVVLDLMLPGVDGLEVCRELRSCPETGEIPIVMLTAKCQEEDIVRGLELGADDYITKPFSPRVLLARIQAVLRRRKQSHGGDSENFHFKELTLHRGRREVHACGNPVDLSFTEFGVLNCLTRRPGWVFTRQQIIESVRGDNYPVTSRSVDFQILQLRRKLGECGHYIETVRGIGYRLKD